MTGNRVRLWILVCAVGCFGAGLSAGLVMPDMVRACCREPASLDPDEGYVQRMTTDFALTGRQQHELRIVMQRYQAEREQVYQHAKFEQLPASLQVELTAAQRRRTDRTRAILNPEQQHRYDMRTRADGSGR